MTFYELLKKNLQINPAACILLLKISLPGSIAVREEVQDQYGNTIYLTDERWEHIVENHPELDGYRAEVISTVRSGKRTQDRMIPYKFYYNKKFPHVSEEFDKIEVVVLFKWQNDQPNNFILTSYPA